VAKASGEDEQREEHSISHETVFRLEDQEVDGQRKPSSLERG
jgi:hypothetical protein